MKIKTVGERQCKNKMQTKLIDIMQVFGESPFSVKFIDSAKLPSSVFVTASTQPQIKLRVTK